MTRVIETVPALQGRTDAEAHVGVICFKLGPPVLIGAELEWLLVHPDNRRTRPSLATIGAALGEYAPHSIASASRARPLPAGSSVTVEPGGQVEISSAPFPDARSLCRALDADVDHLTALLGAVGLQLKDGAADELREPCRQLALPRYCAMEAAFDQFGPYGRLMMCNTAAVQVSVDAGRRGREMATRWAVLHEVGPALVAAFACSPQLHGVPAGRWASQRMRTWLKLDPARTLAPPLDDDDPAAAYARWAMDVPLLCIRDDSDRWAAPQGATFADWLAGDLDGMIGRAPTVDDLKYHLSTLFPPVRANGYFEVRYLDAQPANAWRIPIALFEGLLRDQSTVDQARLLAASTRGRWRDAARFGLADRELRAAATALMNLAASVLDDPALAELVSADAGRVTQGRTPTEEDLS
ncbi:MAG: ergothioneine biosynthesis glutamate--cysteine ligase EgtA [Mycobacteriaceae bacterium]